MVDRCSNLRGLARVNCDIAETINEKISDVKEDSLRLIKSLPSQFVDILDPSGGLSKVISGGVKSFKYLRNVFGKNKSLTKRRRDENLEDEDDDSSQGSKNNKKIFNHDNTSKFSKLLSSILFEIKKANLFNTSSTNLPNFDPFIQAIQKNTTSLSEGLNLLTEAIDSDDEKKEEKKPENKNILKEKERIKSEKNNEKVIKKLGKNVEIIGKPKFFNPIIKIMSSFKKSFDSFFKFFKSKKDRNGGIFSSLMALLALQFGPKLLMLLAGIGKIFSSVGSVFKLFLRAIRFGPLFKITAAIYAIMGAIEGFKEGGILGAIKGLVKGLLGNFVGGILDFGKNAVGFILGLFGLDKLKEKLSAISFEESINKMIDIIFDLPRIVKDFFTDIMGRVRRFFGIGEGTEIDESTFDGNAYRTYENLEKERKAFDRVAEIDTELERTEGNIQSSVNAITALNEAISQETNPETQMALIKSQEEVKANVERLREQRSSLIEERKAQAEIHGNHDPFDYDSALMSEIQTSAIETFDRSQSLIHTSLESTLETNRQSLASTDESLTSFMMAIEQIDNRMKSESDESIRQTLSESRSRLEVSIKEKEESRISLIEEISKIYEVIGTESPDFRNIQLETFNLSENLTSNLEAVNERLFETKDQLERLNQMINNPELEYMMPALQIGIDNLQNEMTQILEEKERIERELDSFAISISFTPYSPSQASVQSFNGSSLFIDDEGSPVSRGVISPPISSESADNSGNIIISPMQLDVSDQPLPAFGDMISPPPVSNQRLSENVTSSTGITTSNRSLLNLSNRSSLFIDDEGSPVSRGVISPPISSESLDDESIVTVTLAPLDLSTLPVSRDVISPPVSENITVSSIDLIIKRYAEAKSSSERAQADLERFIEESSHLPTVTEVNDWGMTSEHYLDPEVERRIRDLRQTKRLADEELKLATSAYAADKDNVTYTPSFGWHLGDIYGITGRDDLTERERRRLEMSYRGSSQANMIEGLLNRGYSQEQLKALSGGARDNNFVGINEHRYHPDVLRLYQEIIMEELISSSSNIETDPSNISFNLTNDSSDQSLVLSGDHIAIDSSSSPQTPNETTIDLEKTNLSIDSLVPISETSSDIVVNSEELTLSGQPLTTSSNIVVNSEELTLSGQPLTTSSNIVVNSEELTLSGQPSVESENITLSSTSLTLSGQPLATSSDIVVNSEQLTLSGQPLATSSDIVVNSPTSLDLSSQPLTTSSDIVVNSEELTLSGQPLNDSGNITISPESLDVVTQPSALFESQFHLGPAIRYNQFPDVINDIVKAYGEAKSSNERAKSDLEQFQEENVDFARNRGVYSDPEIQERFNELRNAKESSEFALNMIAASYVAHRDQVSVTREFGWDSGSVEKPYIEHLGAGRRRIRASMDARGQLRHQARSNANIKDILLSRGYGEEELMGADIHGLYADLIRKDLEKSLGEMGISAEFETPVNQSNTSPIPEVIILPPLTITASSLGIYDSEESEQLSPDTQESLFLPTQARDVQNIETRPIGPEIRTDLIPIVMGDGQIFRVDTPQEIYPLLPISGDLSAVSRVDELSQSRRETNTLESELRSRETSERLSQMNINNNPVIDASTQNSFVPAPPSPVRQPPNSHDIFYGGSRSQLVF